MQDAVVRCRTAQQGVGPCGGVQGGLVGCRTVQRDSGRHSGRRMVQQAAAPHGLVQDQVVGSGTSQSAAGHRTVWFGVGPYNMLGTSGRPGDPGTCCPESTRADISPGTEESEQALPISQRLALMGTWPWGRRRQRGRDPTSQDPTPSPSPLISPSLLITSGSSIPPGLPGHLLPPLLGEPWGQIRNGNTGVPLPLPPPAWPRHHLLRGHWASSQPCRDAAYCQPGHRGAGCRLPWASWHRVPPAPGIMALGTTGSWHHGARVSRDSSSQHPGGMELVSLPDVAVPAWYG